MKKLAAVAVTLVAACIVFLRLTQKSYLEKMGGYADKVLADTDRLQELLEQESIAKVLEIGEYGETEAGEEFLLRLGPEDEATRILWWWSDIRWKTDRHHFQVPPEFWELHDKFWIPVRRGMADVDNLIRQNNKERASAELVDLRTRVEEFQKMLRI